MKKKRCIEESFDCYEKCEKKDAKYRNGNKMIDYTVI